MEPLRVLLADDHPVFRRGLRMLLDAQPEGAEIVGEACNGMEAVELARELQPDVVVMDLQMPELNGIEATQRIVEESPHIGVLVLTMFEDDESVFAAMRAGARGYLLKGAEQEDMLAAIRSVAAGQVVVGPSVAKRLLGYLSAPPGRNTPFPDLTPREREILDRVAQGHSNHAIARGLGVASKTVANHMSAVLTKLQVATRAEAIILARDQGLGRG